MQAFFYFFGKIFMETWERRLAIFKAAYPIWKGSGYANKVFKRMKIDDVLLEKMLTAIKEQIAERELMRDINIPFIPAWKHPSTWLNQQCWEDEVTMVPDKLRTQYGCTQQTAARQISETIRNASVRSDPTKFNPFK